MTLRLTPQELAALEAAIQRELGHASGKVEKLALNHSEDKPDDDYLDWVEHIKLLRELRKKLHASFDASKSET